MRLRPIYILPLFILLLSPTLALGANGIKGRVAWRGELVPGIKVRAYRSVPDIAAGKAVGTSAPTGLDGIYSLELPPGEYYVTARDFEGKPAPDKHFCYYSGAPVRVTAGNTTNVGFNLIRIPKEAPPVTGQGTGVRGEITFQGELLEKSYLYVYKEGSKGFRGPAYFVQPVEKGKFRLRLPPGEYYLFARKRAKGGQFGPVEIGDHFNYYHGNPVRIEDGKVKEVRIETITRLEMLEEGDAPAFRGLVGTVLGPGGKPAAGVRVFAYRNPAMTGHPDLFSEPTGPDGRYRLPLHGDGPWHLLARQSFGGPASPGELYGKAGGTAITLKPKETSREVPIRVENKRD